MADKYVENILKIHGAIYLKYLREAPSVQTKPAALSGRQRQTTSSLSSHLVNTVVNCMIGAISIIVIIIMVFTMIIMIFTMIILTIMIITKSMN